MMLRASLVGQWQRTHLPMQETQVQSLGQEDRLKEMATHTTISAWKIPWTDNPGRLQSMGSQRVGHDLATEHARNDVEHIFHVLICHLYDLFGEMSLLLIFKICVVLFFLICQNYLCLLYRSPLSDVWILDIFSKPLAWLFTLLLTTTSQF